MRRPTGVGSANREQAPGRVHLSPAPDPLDLRIGGDTILAHQLPKLRAVARDALQCSLRRRESVEDGPERLLVRGSGQDGALRLAADARPHPLN